MVFRFTTRYHEFMFSLTTKHPSTGRKRHQPRHAPPADCCYSASPNIGPPLSWRDDFEHRPGSAFPENKEVATLVVKPWAADRSIDL